MTDLTNAPAAPTVSDHALDAALLARLLAEAGIAVPEQVVATIGIWADELVAWNERFNLTRITSPQEIAIQHALDALMGLRALGDLDPRQSWRAVDVGAGNGCPGLILAAARPGWQWTLIESQGKATDFLQHAARAMDLTNVRVAKVRAEDAGRDPDLRERFHIGTARGVARLATLLEYALPLIRVDGRFIAWKGEGADEEISEASGALSQLGGRVRRRHAYQLPGLDHGRRLVVVDKARRTPRSLPRQAGTPKRAPL